MRSIPIEKHLFGYCPVKCSYTEIPVRIFKMNVVGCSFTQHKVENDCKNKDRYNPTCQACPIVQEYSANAL